MAVISITVVDKQAESRARMVGELTHALQSASISDLLPRISLVPRSLQELKFHAAPDICVVGPETARRDSGDIAEIRRLFPKAAIIAKLDSSIDDLALIEQFARLGVDDVYLEGVSDRELLTKIILLGRRADERRLGTLIIVDSGKGGMGVTSVAAGLAESLVRMGKRTAIIDFDFDTQDLVRFLQVRPFVNENLQLLFDQSRPVTEEFVDQCLTPVWQDDPLLRCMAPVAESDTLFDCRSSYSRTLISILEIIDSQNDFVIVDAGAVRGVMMRTLYRLADAAIFVSNNDPASVYPTIDKMNHLRGQLAPDAKVLFLCNGAGKSGLSEEVLRNEVCSVATSVPLEYISIPFSSRAARWPASGGTLWSKGDAATKSGFQAVLGALGVVEKKREESLLRLSFEAVRRALVRLMKGDKEQKLESSQSPPALPGQEALPPPEHIEVINPRQLVGALQIN